MDDFNNIWFIRTDKDKSTEITDISVDHNFIYSYHGSCGMPDEIEESDLKGKIFPRLQLDNYALRQLVRDTKIKLSQNGLIDLTTPSKLRCDVFINYWIAVMQEGDIAFVRNKSNELYVCEITGYISESFYDKFHSFQRPVKIIKKIKNSDSAELSKLEKLLHRTYSRRTIERNANHDVRALVLDYLNS